MSAYTADDQGQRPLPLSEMLGQGVSLEWHEGIAITREVAEQLLATSPGVFPELSQIELLSTGTIRLTGTVRADEPVRRLGQLLQATLGGAEPPVQVRLAISQGTAPTPTFASIGDYNNALAYFERPQRQVVLAQLYERALAGSAAQAADDPATPTLDAIAPLPQIKSPEKKAVRRMSGRAVAGIAAVVALVAGSAAAVQYANARGVTPRSDEVAALATRASHVLGDAMVSGISTVTETIGLGRLVPPDAPAGAPPVKAPEKAAARPRPRRDPKPPAEQAFLAFDLDPLAIGVRPVRMPEIARTAPSERLEVFAEPVADPRIYSPASEGVFPPVGRQAHFQHELPESVSPADLCAVELVVAADGVVESAKLLERPRNIHESMVLSVAKAWQFDPALKDGLPVRYRKIVWIAPR